MMPCIQHLSNSPADYAEELSNNVLLCHRECREYLRTIIFLRDYWDPFTILCTQVGSKEQHSTIWWSKPCCRVHKTIQRAQYRYTPPQPQYVEAVDGDEAMLVVTLLIGCLRLGVTHTLVTLSIVAYCNHDMAPAATAHSTFGFTSVFNGLHLWCIILLFQFHKRLSHHTVPFRSGVTVPDAYQHVWNPFSVYLEISPM